MTNLPISVARGMGRVLWESYRLGARTWLAAPAIVAIAVVPEFVQHVVEIRLGMFHSLDRFQQLADHPTR